MCNTGIGLMSVRPSHIGVESKLMSIGFLLYYFRLLCAQHKQKQ